MFLFLLFVFIIGISVGSFINVVVDRSFREESVIKKRSYCEGCKKTLSFPDLVPVFSFIFIRGKCRYCGISLSLYYPLVEFATGFLFVLIALLFHPVFSLSISPLSLENLIFYFFISVCFEIVFLTDLKYGFISDKVVYLGIAASLLWIILTDPSAILIRLIAAFSSFFLFLLIFALTKGKGMGFGDVKLVFLIGLVLGVGRAILALYLAFLTGGVISLILVLCKRKKFFKDTVSFGPFLAAGALVSLFWGSLFLPKIMVMLGI